MPSEFDWLIEQLRGVNRMSEDIPEGFEHLSKEVFAYGDIIVKKTFHEKNQGKDAYLFENEADWLEVLGHYSFIPRLIGKEYVDGDVYLFTERFKGVSLDRFRLPVLPWKKRRFLNELNQLFDVALAVFEKEGVTHKDLRPHNVVVSRDLTVFGVVDFQFCSRLGEGINPNGPSQFDHYEAAIKGVGGQWRMPGLEVHSFESDRYAVNKIIESL